MAVTDPRYGYRKGASVKITAKVDSATADIEIGDMLVAGTAGYVQQAAAGELPIGVALTRVTSPSADGDVEVLMEVSPLAIFEYPADTGSVSQGLAGTTMDVGGPQTIDIDASADDVVICREVNIAKDTLLVSFIFTHAGVV